MITLKYKVTGNDEELIKQFVNENDYQSFLDHHQNVVVVSVERSGAAAFNRIYGV